MARRNGRRRNRERQRSGRVARRLGVAAAFAAGAFLPGAAEATFFAETQLPDGDFGFPPELLPDGTTVVTGHIACCPEDFDADFGDFFAFGDLIGGAGFSIQMSVINADCCGLFQLYDEGGNPLTGFLFVDQDESTSVSGVIPISGELVVGAFAGEDTLRWAVSLDAPRVPAPIPEPGSSALFGAGVLAVGARLRRR